LTSRCGVLVGVDYDEEALKAHPSITWRTRGDITRLPFRNEAFDLATANMVVEHLDDPETQFREVSRILKPGGLFVFHTPNARGYGVTIGRLVPRWVKLPLIRLLQGRNEQDVYKTYYRANTERRIQDLAGQSGFEVKDVHLFVSDAVFAMVPPLAVLELVWLRLMMTGPFRLWRTNIIGVLKKRG
jgi:ubiquinone/menaquinone biosynthesis C-methylase UbiE